MTAPPTSLPLLNRRPLKCDGPPPQWVSSALETAKQVKLLTLAIPVELAPPSAQTKATTTTTKTTATPPAAASSSSSLRLLLGRKKRGFGEGYFNGFGGKLEPGESTDEATARELREESGLVSRALEHVGVLTFVFEEEKERPWQVHVYAVPSWEGTPVETDEMAPIWFDARELPFGRMWADDRYWYPRFAEAVEPRLLAAAAATTRGEAGAGAGEGGGGGGGGDLMTTATTAAASHPCFEGVFGFRNTHEMAWAGLWALERPGEGRSAVADEAAAADAAAAGEGDAGSGPRDGGAGPPSSSSCPWLPPPPAGGEALSPESLEHLRRAAALARATATAAGGKPTAWKGWRGGGGAAESGGGAVVGDAVVGGAATTRV